MVRGSPMPASRHLFGSGSGGSGGRPEPAPDAILLVGYLQSLGRQPIDVWAARRRREPQIPPPPAADAGLLRRGQALYERHCAACHGDAGDGHGEAAPLLLFPPRDFVSGRYRFVSGPPGEPAQDADLFRTISAGTGSGVAMPAFDVLSATDRWALVLRIKQFSPALRGMALRAPRTQEAGRDGEPRASGELLRSGRRLWQTLGCAACHGPGGEGLDRMAAAAAWADPDGNPIPRSGSLTHACAMRNGADPAAIDRALFGGGLAMPDYREAVPDASDRRALRAYVLSLQDGPQGPDP